MLNSHTDVWHGQLDLGNAEFVHGGLVFACGVFHFAHGVFNECMAVSSTALVSFPRCVEFVVFGVVDQARPAGTVQEETMRGGRERRQG